MKIRIRLRLLKIRIVVSACSRLRRLVRRLVLKISLLRSPDRTPQTSSCLCLRRPLVGARISDLAAFNYRRRRKVSSEGYVAVYVGEERRRFVIPILYLSHPFITKLLTEAEAEFGYNYEGPLTVPCNIDDFEQVKWLIDREKTSFQ